VDVYRTVTSFLPLMAAVSHVKGQGRLLDRVWTELSGRMEYTVRDKNEKKKKESKLFSDFCLTNPLIFRSLTHIDFLFSLSLSLAVSFKSVSILSILSPTPVSADTGA